MHKRSIFYIAIVTILFILLVILEGNRKEALSWKQTFCGREKIPYGSYVVKELLKEMYPENSLSENADGIYMFLKINPDPKDYKFIYITKVFSLDNELSQLMQMVRNGNDVFVAAEYFDTELMDTLGFSTNHHFGGMMDTSSFSTLHFESRALDLPQGYKVSQEMADCYFDSLSGNHTTVMATDGHGRPVFIKSRYGKGDFYISTTPLLFTNYNVLYGNADYPFTALSCLRGRTFIWDEYYKPFRVEISTPVRYLLTQPALKAAYGLLMITLLIYLLFRGKRKQRMIPVLAPPKNQSLEFVKTIGQMYFNTGNNRDIAMKKYFHFCDYVRTKYQIRNFVLEVDFFKMLSDRSGVDAETVSVIFKLAAHIQYQHWTSDEVLMSFNDKIEEFYNKTK